MTTLPLTPTIPPKKLGLGPRCAAFLRSRYPKGEQVKGVMRDLDVSQTRAKALLRGWAPTARQLEQLESLYGEDLLRAVFIEAWERKDGNIEALRRERDAAQRRVKELEARLLAMAADLAPAGTDGEPLPAAPDIQLSLGKKPKFMRVNVRGECIRRLYAEIRPMGFLQEFREMLAWRLGL